MSDVQTFYDQHAEAEWTRLDRHRTEFAVTLRALREFLPPSPARILDIGGGPGRYAIALTLHGYQVTLVDFSQASLALAHDKARQAGVTFDAVVHANALDLSALPAAAYASVLLMGPLYHLLTPAERWQAVQEARRVLTLQGCIFAAFVTRFAPLRDCACRYPATILDHWAYVEPLLAMGVDHHPQGFADAYFAHPADIVPWMERAGFATLGLLGCEGIVAGHEEPINTVSGEAWERWVDLNYRLGQDPSLHGAADHLLYIGHNIA
jgi:S-adenosylmethionine-dependent methyltransferase